jgi:hypothetical protein
MWDKRTYVCDAAAETCPTVLFAFQTCQDGYISLTKDTSRWYAFRSRQKKLTADINKLAMAPLEKKVFTLPMEILVKELLTIES